MELKINSRKYGEKEFIIDNEDYKKVKDYKWHLMKVKNFNRFYIVSTGKTEYRRNIYLHRLIMNCPESKIIDHIDGNTLNNQKSNLRICSQADNVRNNSKKRNSKTSKYKGVYFSKVNKTFYSFIMFNKKHYHLGCFKDEKEAALNYNLAANKFFGEFAKLNIIEGV